MACQVNGHRILIFSQWTRILDLLEVLLNDIDLKFLRLDGSTPVKVRLLHGHDILVIRLQIYFISIWQSASRKWFSNSQDRQALISDFSDVGSTTPIFLLSTKAGGLGINLTAADMVIIHDLDFNPENDRQAEVQLNT